MDRLALKEKIQHVFGKYKYVVLVLLVGVVLMLLPSRQEKTTQSNIVAETVVQKQDVQKNGAKNLL